MLFSKVPFGALRAFLLSCIFICVTDKLIHGDFFSGNQVTRDIITAFFDTAVHGNVI